MSLFNRGGDELPRIKALPKRRARIISVLDVGSEKISCLIARLKPRLASEMLPGRTHTIEVPIRSRSSASVTSVRTASSPASSSTSTPPSSRSACASMLLSAWPA